VAIYRDHGVWCAQGNEIDYMTQGSSREDVKQAFERGLAATIELNLAHFGHIERLLNSVPLEIWERATARGACRHHSYSQVSTHNLAPISVEYFETA
jgi:hypothetical protein